jgi:hypothetical protein
LIGFILTSRKGERSIDEISEALESFSDLVQIIPSEPSAGLTVVLFFLGVGLLFFGIWSVADFEIGTVRLPAAFSIWLPFCALPCGAVLVLVAILRLTECGRQFVTKAKRVMRRYGLRIILLLVQTLYIPIISLMVDLLLPERFTCGDGNYIRYTYDRESPFAPFVVRSFECTACMSANLSETCEALCHVDHATAPWRIQLDPGLLYVDDSIKPVGLIILYAFGAIVVGIPLLFWKIVSTNQTIVSELLVWGHDSHEKWDNVLARVSSSGVALFADFEYAHSKWSLLQLMTSLGVMLLSVMQDRLSKQFLYLFPVIYGLVCFWTCKQRPYRSPMNDILDGWLFFVLGLFTILPLVELNGIAVSGSVETGLMSTAVVCPFIAFFSSFCLKTKDRVSDEDPTIPKENPNSKKKKDPRSLKIKQLKGWKETHEPPIRISYESIQSVQEQFLEEVQAKTARIEDGVPPPVAEYMVPQSVLGKQMFEMYRIVDLVLDGATTEVLLKVLSTAVTISFIGCGFYIGFVTGTELPEKAVC